MNRTEAELLLQSTFKFQSFYDEQWLAIEKILRGERVLMIERTGFGKSLCFQFPAVAFPGVTVVFSPLIALMRDQVKKLNSLNIPAACVNSEQTPEENTEIIRNAIDGKLKIVYIAPERQENSEWIDSAKQMNLSMIVIDEAHCISVWGHDFRPAFQRIVQLVNLLPAGLPVLAVTATATKRVETDILKQIGNGVTLIRGNLMRENFKLFVIRVNSNDEKMLWLGKNLDKMPGSGVLYTGTRSETEMYQRWLQSLNIPVVHYNAGLEPEKRIEIENGLLNNTWKCVISTNALGMGIDKPDIRFIIHTQMPQSPVHYYQEIGRAGRDGEPAYIILFYNPEDKELPLAFIENARPPADKYQLVIKTIKSELLSEKEIIIKANLKQNQFRIIKHDLTEQKIIREVRFAGKKKYEYILNAPEFSYQPFEELRLNKLQELEAMINYAETKDSRMEFLCRYLGDSTHHRFTNCDNTGEKKLSVILTEEWQNKLEQFHENDFPTLYTETKNTVLTNGVAASYYGVSAVGNTLHKCKYENGGDYPEFLVKLTAQAFIKTMNGEKFDILLYVPPTSSGTLVKNFSVSLSVLLNIPVSHNLVKIKNTQPQKVFQSAYAKKENVLNAFSVEPLSLVQGKSVLLVDDICDSGATIKEIGKMLSKAGAVRVTPLVIAKTVSGDSV